MSTIAELAMEFGRPKRTVARLLFRLHAAMGGDWYTRVPGPTVKLRRVLINRERLRAAHPGLFSVRYVERAEVESLATRVENCEVATKETRRQVLAVAANVRDLRSEVRNGTTRVTSGHG
jgi:hypothetical protein